ncbi:MAG: glycosyltransferase [Chitinophagaceae bacterium]|nr:MAG: glycosyltransferase [Chitinophagaceae bacterium]
MGNQGTKIKILYLYAELASYPIAIMKELINEYDAEIIVISWDENRQTPYKPPLCEGITYFKKSDFSTSTLIEFSINLNPDMIYISGWMDKMYIKVCRRMKKIGVPIVAGCDTQWRGSFRQYVASLISSWYQHRFINYIWVAGVRQYEYAKKLGFNDKNILFNCYSADIKLFDQAYLKSLDYKRKRYPRTLIFVGRFHEDKGIRLLIDAYKELRAEQGMQWQLVLIGNGGLYKELTEISVEGIQIKDFMQPELLVQIVGTAGVFILPSLFEQWGVVIHEFAAGGLPLITSDCCGASTEFLIPGYNGFLFENGNKEALKTAILRLTSLSEEELLKYGSRSNMLSKKISPQTSAAFLVSILK